MPVSKTAGDSVIGGTINQSGAFVMRAERVGDQTVFGADRAPGCRGPDEPGADSKTGGPRLGDLRSGRGCHRRA